MHLDIQPIIRVIGGCGHCRAEVTATTKDGGRLQELQYGTEGGCYGYHRGCEGGLLAAAGWNVSLQKSHSKDSHSDPYALKHSKHTVNTQETQLTHSKHIGDTQ